MNSKMIKKSSDTIDTDGSGSISSSCESSLLDPDIFDEDGTDSGEDSSGGSCNFFEGAEKRLVLYLTGNINHNGDIKKATLAASDKSDYSHLSSI